MNHPHHSPSELRLLEEESMPPTIKFFDKPLPSRHLANWWYHHRPIWTWRAQRIFHQHHRLLRHVPTRHPLPEEDLRGKWWSRRLIINSGGELIPSLATPKSNLKQHHYCPDIQIADPGTILWRRYPGNLQLAQPGTCKSQVLICAIHHAIEEEMSILVAAQVALLAQGYEGIRSFSAISRRTPRTAPLTSRWMAHTTMTSTTLSRSMTLW